jgi:dTDP-4-dehydrorhamnose reductase
MRVAVTGAAGFVGSNVAAVAAGRSHDVVCLVRSAPPLADARCAYVPIDLLDEPALRSAVREARPDAIVHTAILNDLARLYEDRELAWRSYVDVTRTLADAATEVGALLVYVSTDWVFDGTQSNASERTPPNPINLYGFLKAAGELVALERPGAAAVARIAGVMGTHRSRPELPRAQDVGFGYFVAALVESLRAGERFTVWDGPGLNALATPTLATDAAELVWRALDRGVTGVLHCCGGEHADRVGLARRAIAAFDLDGDLLDVGPPPAGAVPPEGVPRDTRLDASLTATMLDVTLPALDTQLARLRAEMERAWSVS